MSHGIHINESWHTYGWDTTLAATMFGARTLLLSHRLGRYSIFEWVMSMSHAQISNVVSHISISHGIHLNETRRQTLAAFVDWKCIPYMYDSCHAYQWVMPHTSMGHATYINESCHSKNLPKQQNLSSHEIRTEKISWSLSWKRGPYRLRFPAEAAFQTQNITWKSDRT